jgi:ATP-binding cassette subfamily B protein
MSAPHRPARERRSVRKRSTARSVESVDPMSQHDHQTQQRSGRTNSIRPALRAVLGGYRRAVATMAGASFLGGLAEALLLVTVTRVAFAVTDGRDRVGIVADRYLSIGAALGLAVILIVARVVLAGVAMWQNARVSASVVAQVRRRLAKAFLASAWEVQQTQKSGSLQQLVGQYSTQAASLTNGFGSATVALANLLAMLGLAVAIDPLGAIVMFVCVTLLGSLLRPIRKAVRSRARAANRANMRLGVDVNETSELGMELHVFHVQDAAEHRLMQRIDEARDSNRRLYFATGSLSTVYSALAYLALVAALFAVAQSDSAELTSMGAVMLVMLRSLSYGQALQTGYLSVVGSAPAIEELTEHIETLERGRRHDGGRPVGKIRTLELDRVSFSYDGGSDVLHDVSFRLEPSEIIGIVGPSGGGKSTLVQLLLGLRDARAGSIRADGRDIGEFAKAEWARRVTFVPQASHLIAGSVADNIRFLRPDVSDEAVERAARLAHVHDDIVGLADGYQTEVGDHGGRLSGGQQQRVCIARALVESPDVLILDEPTSALDVKSEHLVRATLQTLKAQMTVVVVAHRLSTLDICDRIMVIQAGRVMAFDAPDRLAGSSDFYREALELSGLR